MSSTYDQAGIQPAFVQDQVGLNLDDFPLHHVFSDDYDLEEENEVDIDGEPLFENEIATQATGVQPKRKSTRTKAYTTAKDKLLCERWRDIGQDPKVGTEQKASTFRICVHREFPEHKKFSPYQMQSTREWVSISKQWKVIQQECNKFCATYESIKARPMSGIGMQGMAEKQATVLQMEAEKQAKMLEIETVNAKTKAKEVLSLP
ncbi:Lectin-domain containing receptor kinase A4.3 [Hordeum vulgare]|nr:Lectin-domain containing receptor kinase A4.3 [Hordeum vulgare]